MTLTMKSPIRLASLPGIPDKPWSIPYIALFYNALEPHGISLICELVPTVEWLGQQHGEIDAIHFHWPEKIWNREFGSGFQRFQRIPGYFRWRRVTRFLRSILGLRDLRNVMNYIRSKGLRVVWTIHELEPLSGNRRINTIGYKILADYADLVICHSECTRNSFVVNYGHSENTVVMKHGNFREAYPLARPRSNVLRDIGFREHLPVVCILGSLRKYKGVDLAIEAVASLSGQVQLLIAGAPFPDFSTASCIRRISQVEGAVLIPQELSPQQFADFASCSEALLLPYKRITTSGIMHAAFTFHRGVVASDLPYFRESLHGNINCGRLFRPEDPSALAAAIEGYLKIPAKLRYEAAKEFAENHSWDKVISPVVMAIEKWRKYPSESIQM